MLEMQRLAPEMRKLQNAVPQRPGQAQRRDDEALPGAQGQPDVLVPAAAGADAGVHHHVPGPPRADLPARRGAPAPVAQAVVRRGRPAAATSSGSSPATSRHDSALFESLVGQTEMMSFGLDLAKSPAEALAESFATGLVYVLLVAAARRALLRPAAHGRRPGRRQPDDVAQPAEADAVPAGGRSPSSRSSSSLGLVIYYMAQAILRIGQQAYITRAFYGHDEALGRQAQRAGEQARELAKQTATAVAVAAASSPRPSASWPRPKTRQGRQGREGGHRGQPPPAAAADHRPPRTTKRTTAPKGRPTPSGKGPAGRPPVDQHSRRGRTAGARTTRRSVAGRHDDS